MNTLPNKRPKAPLYSIDGIVIGTLLGSLVAGIYMMMHNYFALGAARLARQTLIAGGILYGIVLVASTLAPPQAMIALFFALGQAGLAYLIARRLQGESLIYYAKQGMEMHGLFRSALVGLLAGVLSLFVALFIYMLTSI